LETGSILPIPDNPNPNGWQTLGGDPYCTYAHTLGGVSLFDFDQFDPESYATRCPACDWYTFVPYREKWGSSVWIEIDRQLVAAQLITGPDLIKKWKLDDAYERSIMPEIEAVHLGPLPRATFVRAFIVGENESGIRELAV
jgi:hypothetical protein